MDIPPYMIGLHQFLYLRFFNGKKNFPSKCPNNNLNIQGRVNAETTKNVKSWPACSEICSQREDCNYWISAKKISTGTIELVQLVQLNLNSTGTIELVILLYRAVHETLL